MGPDEFQTQLGAGHQCDRCEDQEGEVGLLDGALQAVPAMRGDAAQGRARLGGEVEQDEIEVGIAREDVGGRQGVLQATATNP